MRFYYEGMFNFWRTRSFSKKNLLKASRTSNYKNVLSEIKNHDREVANLISDLTNRKTEIENNYERIIVTFFLNKVYQNRYLSQSTNKSIYVTGYSAGIFNVLDFIKCLELKDTLDLIKERSILVDKYSGSAQMYLIKGILISTVKKVIEANQLSIEISIYTSNKSAILVCKYGEIEKLIDRIKNTNKFIYKKIEVNVPYHTKFLKPIEQDYKKILEKLDFNDTNKNVIFSNNNLKTELLSQLTTTFNWSLIIERIKMTEIETIYDATPNKFSRAFLPNLKIK